MASQRNTNKPHRWNLTERRTWQRQRALGGNEKQTKNIPTRYKWVRRWMSCWSLWQQSSMKQETICCSSVLANSKQNLARWYSPSLHRHGVRHDNDETITLGCRNHGKTCDMRNQRENACREMRDMSTRKPKWWSPKDHWLWDCKVVWGSNISESQHDNCTKQTDDPSKALGQVVNEMMDHVMRSTIHFNGQLAKQVNH